MSDEVLRPQDIVSDAEYERIVNAILSRARTAPKGSWEAYEKAKDEHWDRIGLIPGDPRYDRFITRLTDVLKL